MSEITVSAPPHDAPPARRWLIPILLMMCLTCAYMDKQIISILVEPIQRDLGLTDLQIGLLQGFAFTLCHATMGLVLARRIDVGNRSRIAAWCIAGWSFATASCALATSFPGLLVSRAATAMTEAGLPPSALSLLRDKFEGRHLARATSIFMLGPYMGMGLALIGGGAMLSLLNAHDGLTIGAWHLAPWRALFVLVGLPGIVLALTVRLFVRDPRSERTFSDKSEIPAMWPTYRLQGRFYTFYFLGIALGFAPLYAQMAWVPTFFIRVHHFSPAQIGALVGPLYLIFGIIGSLLGGWLAGKGSSPLRQVLRLLVIANLIVMLCSTALPLFTNPTVSLAMFAISACATSVTLALVGIPLQIVPPPNAVARFAVLFAVVISLGGGGLGPLAVGYVTDQVFADPLMVGKSLALVCFLAALCGVLGFALAERTHPRG